MVRPRSSASRDTSAWNVRSTSSFGRGSPRRTHARVPSAKTQSSPRTHARVAPIFTVRVPAAFDAHMPPMVQNAPDDGSTGKRRPCARAAASTASRSAPGPHHTVAATGSTAPMASSRERSSATPRPMAPFAMELAEPRGTIGT